MSEEGGRVNRVGFTRIERSGSITEYGFFNEYTRDSLWFDNDAELYSHISREMVEGANQIMEDLIQKDLINAAGTVVYPGTANSLATVTAEGTDPSIVDYTDLKRLSITLTDNRTPFDTTYIKGSRLVDTATINKARIMFIGSELQTTVENMVHKIGNTEYPAFIPVHKYADAGNLYNGEIGSIGDFRIVIAPEMQHKAGAGAAVVTNPGYRETGGNYDVFPMLVVGSESFATVGLQADGKKGSKNKFELIVAKPGKDQATTLDPYGRKGFSSISFFHGFIALRPERIGIIWTVAPV